MKKTILTIALSTIAATSISSAQASKLNEWFPQIFGPPRQEQVDKKLEETLKSPFQSKPSTPSKNNFLSGLKNDDKAKKIDYTTRHRSAEQIGVWLSDIVARTLTMEVDTINQHALEIQPFLTPTGQAQLRNFLIKTKITAVMAKYNVKASTIVTAPPKIEQEAPVDGFYNWLFTVPVTVTYIPNDFKNYHSEELNKDSRKFKTADFKIRAQVTRVKEEIGEHNVKIELWQNFIEE